MVRLTAFGCTDEVLGKEDGTFEYMRGFCQGASESPAGWVACYDILLNLQEKHAVNDGIKLMTSEGKSMNYYGTVLADTEVAWIAVVSDVNKSQLKTSKILFMWRLDS